MKTREIRSDTLHDARLIAVHYFARLATSPNADNEDVGRFDAYIGMFWNDIPSLDEASTEMRAIIEGRA